jgi:hypothetical protein
MMSSDGLAQSVLVSRSKANGVTLDEWPGMASSKFALESMIWKNPNELSNLIGCISNKTLEVSAEVGMNLGDIDVGKVVGAQGSSSQGGDGAGTNTSKDMGEVFCGKKVIGLVWRIGEVTLLGVEFGVVGGSSTHAVDEVDMKEIWLYQMLYPDIK